jgi:hypothetical protein
MALQKSSVPLPQQQLVELMQRINFGRIEGLVIGDGRPVLDPPPQITREIKLSGENGPRPEAEIGDFSLKSQVIELFAYFDEIQNGVIDVLEIKHGLPFRMIVREVPT